MNGPDNLPEGDTGRGSPWFGWTFKLLVTTSLCLWLVRSGLLELARVRVLLESWRLLLSTVGLWLVVTVGLSTVRFGLIMRIAGQSPGTARLVLLQMVGLFYNAVVPGNVGGDVIKNYYVFGARPKIVLPLVLLERAAGLLGLLLLAAAFSPLVWFIDADLPDAAQAARGLGVYVWLLLLGLCAGLAGLHFWARRPASRSSTGARRLETLRNRVRALFGYFRDSPGLVAGSLFVSCLIHAGDLLYFFAIARFFLGAEADLLRVAMTFPFGMLSFVLPVSLSGLGVGHLAFDQLFVLVGLREGANVFHVYICGLLGPMLLGALPAIFIKRQVGDPSARGR